MRSKLRSFWSNIVALDRPADNGICTNCCRLKTVHPITFPKGVCMYYPRSIKTVLKMQLFFRDTEYLRGKA